jgi:Predicted metal-dependent RNase, consists of a metallo-beta-lactamase domain and an RNA-binding KH domain
MSFKDYIEETRRIFDRILPENGITEIDYEGPNIVVYTKNEALFSGRDDIARQVAQEIRRRIAIRPDPSILTDEVKAEEIIRQIVPEDAAFKNVYFEADTGEVVIELEDPQY